MMMMTLSRYIDTLQDCFRLYRRSFIIQLLIFIAYVLSIPRFKPSAGAIAQRVLDIGLHAAPVGGPVIMIFCSIAARGWLKPKSIEELRPGTLKIVGETEVVAFDKTGTLTGSLVSMHARPDARLVNAVFLANLITNLMVHAHVLYKRLHRIRTNLLHVVSVDRCFSGVLWPSLIHLLTPEDLFGPPECHPPLWVCYSCLLLSFMSYCPPAFYPDSWLCYAVLCCDPLLCLAFSQPSTDSKCSDLP